MGKLNEIQDKVIKAMSNPSKLGDVSFPFTAVRTVHGAYDPDGPPPSTTLSYSGTGIFGLSFTQRDLEVFQVESNDMKGMFFQRSVEQLPKIDDTITWLSTDYKVINIVVIPADNGVVCQLRAYE